MKREAYVEQKLQGFEEELRSYFASRSRRQGDLHVYAFFAAFEPYANAFSKNMLYFAGDNTAPPGTLLVLDAEPADTEKEEFVRKANEVLGTVCVA